MPNMDVTEADTRDMAGSVAQLLFRDFWIL
jgi:hypothetical protein